MNSCMPGRRGATSNFTKELHVRRLGGTPLPKTLKEALLRDPQLKDEVKSRVSEAAKRADRLYRRLEVERAKRS
jgi:hypothetical protein